MTDLSLPPTPALPETLFASLPADRLGPLAVRSRGFDVTFCAALGGAIMWLVLIE